jgi:hypothetical protein
MTDPLDFLILRDNEIAGLHAEIERLRAENERLNTGINMMAVEAERLRSALDKATSYPLRQLRHAYEQLAACTVVRQKEFADGLIAPQIRAMEDARRVLEEK